MNDNKQTIRGIVVRVSKGTNKLSFTVRFTDNVWKDKDSGETKYNRKYVNCFVGGKYAEILESNLYQGRHVVVIGKISAGAYIDKDGKAQGVLNMNDLECIYVDERIDKQVEHVLEVLESANLGSDGKYSFSKEEAVEAVENFMEKNKVQSPTDEGEDDPGF